MTDVLTPTDDLLAGFHFVESDGIATITLDKQRRLYLNATTQKLTGVAPYDALSLAYNPATKELAVVRGGSYTAERMTSQFNVDKRYYLSARHFTRTYGFDVDVNGPFHFDYVRGSGVNPTGSAKGSVFIFKLREV